MARRRNEQPAVEQSDEPGKVRAANGPARPLQVTRVFDVEAAPGRRAGSEAVAQPGPELELVQRSLAEPEGIAITA